MALNYLQWLICHKTKPYFFISAHLSFCYFLWYVYLKYVSRSIDRSSLIP